jgi:hypothetical protein
MTRGEPQGELGRLGGGLWIEDLSKSILSRSRRSRKARWLWWPEESTTEKPPRDDGELWEASAHSRGVHGAHMTNDKGWYWRRGWSTIAVLVRCGKDDVGPSIQSFSGQFLRPRGTELQGGAIVNLVSQVVSFHASFGHRSSATPLWKNEGRGIAKWLDVICGAPLLVRFACNPGYDCCFPCIPNSSRVWFWCGLSS